MADSYTCIVLLFGFDEGAAKAVGLKMDQGWTAEYGGGGVGVIAGAVVAVVGIRAGDSASRFVDLATVAVTS